MTQEIGIQKLHLIRHGITEGNKNHWYYGAMDIPLLPEGKEEIRALKEQGIYPCPETEEYYTTGLIRTEETFFILYGDRFHKQRAELREMNFGIFEGKSYKDLEHDKVFLSWIDPYDMDAPAPEGESANQVLRRGHVGEAALLKAQAEYCTEHPEAPRESVVVCHGGMIGLLISDAYGVADRELYRYIPNPGRGYTLLYKDGRFIGEEPI